MAMLDQTFEDEKRGNALVFDTTLEVANGMGPLPRCIDPFDATIRLDSEGCHPFEMRRATDDHEWVFRKRLANQWPIEGDGGRQRHVRTGRIVGSRRGFQ